jgi:hypothetical protein
MKTIIDQAKRSADAATAWADGNKKAWDEYQDCVWGSPISQAALKNFNAMTVSALTPIPGNIGKGKIVYRTAKGMYDGATLSKSLLTAANASTFAFSWMVNVLLYLPQYNTDLEPKIRPIEESCMKRIKEKYGFRPMSGLR